MKISTKGRYGVRLMLDLASHCEQGPVLLKDIAARQEISEKYLWHLIPPLKNAGMIRSTRGAHGGYSLAKSPARITLKDIVSVLEGSLCLVECVDNPSVCKRSKICVSRDIWCEAAQNLMQKLTSFSLEKMVEKERIKQESAADRYTYFI